MKKSIAAIAAIIVIAGGLFCYNYYQRYYKANSVKNDALIKIYRKTDYAGLLDSLSNAKVLRSVRSFEKAAAEMGLKENFKPGLYKVKGGLSNKAIVRMFANGWQVPMDLPLKGYIRNDETMAGYLGARLEADSTEFLAAMRDHELIGEFGFNKATILSVFLPDTYQVYWTVTPADFLRRMKKEYDTFWNKSRTDKAADIGLSKDQVMTLASIVIEETKYEPEMPTVAGVYINRINRGIPLQADPTIKFALNKPGITRILNQDLKIESPYNTYIHTGLPPGPITIAPKVAIDAVLNYKRHNYIYFCAKETFDGQHNFSETYSEHINNARAYHAALNAKKITR